MLPRALCHPQRVEPPNRDLGTLPHTCTALIRNSYVVNTTTNTTITFHIKYICVTPHSRAIQAGAEVDITSLTPLAKTTPVQADSQGLQHRLLVDGLPEGQQFRYFSVNRTRLYEELVMRHWTKVLLTVCSRNTNSMADIMTDKTADSKTSYAARGEGAS